MLRDKWFTVLLWFMCLSTIAVVLDEIMGGAELATIGLVFGGSFMLLVALGSIHFMRGQAPR